MHIASTWRQVPAMTLEEVVVNSLGAFPPTLEALETLIRSHDYDVVYTNYYPVAVTEHETRVISIPPGTPDKMLSDLLHEVSEILLSLPVAAEFVHPPTGQNEHHNVAVIATHQIHKRFSREKERLRRQRRRLAKRVAITEEALQEFKARLAAYNEAVQANRFDVAPPDLIQGNLCHDLLANLIQQIKIIDAKLEKWA